MRLFLTALIISASYSSFAGDRNLRDIMGVVMQINEASCTPVLELEKAIIEKQKIKLISKEKFDASKVKFQIVELYSELDKAGLIKSCGDFSKIREFSEPCKQKPSIDRDRIIKSKRNKAKSDKAKSIEGIMSEVVKYVEYIEIPDLNEPDKKKQSLGGIKAGDSTTISGGVRVYDVGDKVGKSEFEAKPYFNFGAGKGRSLIISDDLLIIDYNNKF